MKFSYNWIGELVNGLRTEAAELSRLITMKTAESEGLEPYGEHLTYVTAARVLSAEPIPNSKNRKAVVDTGADGCKTVVCGAFNCRAGIVTAYVAPGARIAGKEIREAVISGITSQGMLASGAELGINRDAEGILDLDLDPGASLPFLPDRIIEIDNKSLTHRPDLWGHHGMAREVAAILGLTLKEPVKRETYSGDSPWRVSIEDFDLCPRYSALAIDNVTVAPSPLWLQYRLEAIGLNPINNVVDVTNFVMAELGQPMHAFDADRLSGDTIYIRPAKPGEKLLALNNESYELQPSNLVIADSSGAIALAGVIGGLDSAISAKSSRIVFESANFQAASIRKTSSALRLRTDASMRFEKAQDPVNTVRGIYRAVELLRQVCPGIRVTGGIVEQSREPAPPPRIRLPLDWLNRKIGRAVEPAEVKRILAALEFGIEAASPEALTLIVPSWRATKDISLKDDLVEEIGRMIGYASIEPKAPELPVRAPFRNRQREYHERVRQMAAAQGYNEVYNYSFLSDDLARRFGLDPEAHLRVINPIAAGQNLMRTSLVPGIWRNLVENSKYSGNFRLFEIGREIHKRGQSLPNEVNHIAAAIFMKEGNAAGLFELKRLAESLAPGIEVKPTEARLYEHPFRTGEVIWHGQPVGRIFEMHPSFLEGGRGAILDLNLDLLEQLTPPKRSYKPVRRFPSSEFDLSVIAGARDLVGRIGKHLADLSPPEVESVEFVRQYSGPPLPEGKQSVSFRLTVAAPDRTLASEEVTAIRNRIIEGMRESGFDLRV